MNPARIDALNKAKGYFEYASSHPQLKSWQEKAREDYGFYDGTKQWPQHILDELKERGQEPITVNKVKNLINYMSGVEIQTRMRVAFKPHSSNPQDDLLAKALTHLTYFIQESEDIPYKASLQFRDALITGIGWSNLYKDPKTGAIKYECVDPLSVYYDPDDLSHDLTQMTFISRVRWLSLAQAQEIWPNRKEELVTLCGRDKSYASGVPSSEFSHRQGGEALSYMQGDGVNNTRIMVVEVQYRDTKDAWTGMDIQGNPFTAFDKKAAQKLSDEEPITKTKSSQIMRVMFTGDVLLEYAPLEPRIPDLGDFTYIPCIWSRRYEDGVPEGWLSVMKSIQRESNYRRTKLVNNLNSFRAIVDTDTMIGKDIDKIRQELKRPDSVIFKSPESQFSIESNKGLAPGQFEMLERTDQELQQVTGVYDDALGKQTNAESGVAIRERQINSVKNQIFSFDALRMTKKRQGRMILSLIQGGGDENIMAEILEDDERQTLLLNLTREISGKKVVFNDIRTLPLSLYVEEVPDYESSAEESQAQLQALLGNANASLIMQSPLFLKRLGIRDYDALAKEMQSLSKQQMQDQGEMKQMAQGGAGAQTGIQK